MRLAILLLLSLFTFAASTEVVKSTEAAGSLEAGTGAGQRGTAVSD